MAARISSVAGMLDASRFGPYAWTWRAESNRCPSKVINADGREPVKGHSRSTAFWRSRLPSESSREVSSDDDFVIGDSNWWTRP